MSESTGKVSRKSMTLFAGAYLLTGCALLAAIAACADDPTAPPAASRSYVVLPSSADVMYESVAGWLAMDIYEPPNTCPRPSTALVFVHGGKWVGGDKAGGDVGPYDFARFPKKCYTVFSVNYRTGAGIFPAYVEDVRCAIAHIRANAATYRVRADKVGAWGHSAGGHIIALAGLTNAFDCPLYPGFSGRPDAVVTYAGPMDLTALEDFAPDIAADIQAIFPDRFVASPVNYASADDPPFLIVHGTLDESIYMPQPLKMHAAIQTAGGTSTLLTVLNGGHYLTLPSKYKKYGWTTTPSRLSISNTVVSFFDQNIK